MGGASWSMTAAVIVEGAEVLLLPRAMHTTSDGFARALQL